MEKTINKKEIIDNISNKELELLHLLRDKYRWGEVTILMKDGTPVQILKTVDRKALGIVNIVD